MFGSQSLDQSQLAGLRVELDGKVVGGVLDRVADQPVLALVQVARLHPPNHVSQGRRGGKLEDVDIACAISFKFFIMLWLRSREGGSDKVAMKRDCEHAASHAGDVHHPVKGDKTGASG